jgi:hypothetical protein
MRPAPSSSRLAGSGVAAAGLIVNVASPSPRSKVPKLSIGPTNPKLEAPPQLGNAVFIPEKPSGFGFGNIVTDSTGQPLKKPVGLTNVLRKFVMAVSVVIIPGTSNDQLYPKTVLSKLYIASAFAGAPAARKHANINTNTIKLIRMRSPGALIACSLPFSPC